MKKYNKYGLLMFVIGLFSATQVRVIGAVGISELVMMLAAPFLLASNVALFRRDGCQTFINLLFLSFVGCVVSSWYNGTVFFNFIRGFATPYGWFASFCVFYLLLKKDPKSLSWYLLGAAFSVVLTTFVFQNAYEMMEAESRGGDAEAIMSGAIYWTGRISRFVNWPIQGFYMNVPVAYSAGAPVVFALYALFSTASGRSQALMSMAASVMILYVRKDIGRMKSLRRNIVGIMIGLLLFGFAFKTGYAYLASTGRLGEIAQAKYESQTRGGTSALELLREGRGEMFRGLYYCARHPIMGYGPWAIDYEGIYLDYLKKYGLPEDYEEVAKRLAENGWRYVWVGAHSAMLQFWLAYGILGMPVWIYIFYLMYDYFKRRIGGVPEFFGYFAIVIPSVAWAIFFSPFGNRLNWGLFAAMLLLNRMMTIERERCGCVPVRRF